MTELIASAAESYAAQHTSPPSDVVSEIAVDMTAATMERLAATGRVDEIAAHASSIHDMVGQMQRHVRAILQHLRPIGTVGLRTAIEH